MPDTITHHALGDRAASQLANVTKTPPQYGAITPRWLVRFLDWKPLEAGTLRVNRVVDDKAIDVIDNAELRQPGKIGRRAAPHRTENPIALVEEEPRQVGTILAGDAGDQRRFGTGILHAWLARNDGLSA